jgi:hypothetical protein
MERVLHEFPYQNSVEKLEIVKSDLEQISILGAAALYFENHRKKFKKMEII